MSLNPLQTAHIERLLDDCVETLKCSNHPFSGWEREFIESVAAQFKESEYLTPKQIKHLEEVWEKI